MCLGAGGSDECSWPVFTCVKQLVPLKTLTPSATQVCHIPNLLTSVIFQTRVIHWQHCHLSCHPTGWHQHPVNDPPNTLMSYSLDFITSSNFSLFSHSGFPNILVLVFNWKYSTSFILYYRYLTLILTPHPFQLLKHITHKFCSSWWLSLILLLCHCSSPSS